MTANPRIRADRLRATESYYGAHRAERPNDFRDATVVCPFCPGNEARTGALLTADPGVHWQSRVIANLYPAVVEPDGRHEVIVEMRAHGAAWSALDRASIERILRIYRERELAGYADGFAFVAVFKNSGAGSGASLTHPHAQVIALRAIPASIAARVERLRPECRVCAALFRAGPHTVAQYGAVVAYVPDGSRTSFEVRFAPIDHTARFSECPATTLSDLARAVHDVHRRLAAALGEGFPFNMIVQSAPRDSRAESRMHWEIELLPRIENFGGFEVGTGGFLVSRTPEDAARMLRAVSCVADA